MEYVTKSRVTGRHLWKFTTRNNEIRYYFYNPIMSTWALVDL